MKNWYEVRNSDDSILRRIEADDDWTPPVHKFGVDALTRIVPEMVQEQPQFNPATHICTTASPVATPDSVVIGWDVVMIPPPASVPLWAFRYVLTKRSLLGSIDSVIASLPDEVKIKAMALFEYKEQISRGNPLIDVLGARIGISTDDIDSIFKEAAAADEIVSHEVLSEPQRQSVFQVLWAKLFGP